jgi:DNA-binding response OmpR family regulator
MKKILVVDDEKEVLESLKSILTRNSYEAITTLSSEDALKIAKLQHPDLVLLDINMPEMDGRDVLARLKKDDSTKNIPVIMVTARIDQLDRDCSLELGAHEYITKPCDHNLLLRQISNILNK